MLLYSQDVFHSFDIHEEYTYKNCFLVSYYPSSKWKICFQGMVVSIDLFSKEDHQNWSEFTVRDFDDDEIYKELGINKYAEWLESGMKGEKWIDISDDLKAEMREKMFDKYISSNGNVGSFYGELVGPTSWLNYLVKEYFELYMYY